MDYGLIPGGLLRLADTLLKWVPERLKARRDQADRFAGFCDRIAHVLDHTVASLRQGRTPHGSCAELDRYMHNAVDILRTCVSVDDLAQIGHDLNFAYQIEYLDLAFADTRQRESGFVATEAAAGRFRSLATTLRATEAGMAQ